MRSPIAGKSRSAPRLAGLLVAVVCGLAAPGAAEARGFVGFGFGVPLGPPAYYPPPPVYYAPLPPVYYPPPAYYYPPPAYYPPPQASAPPSTVGDSAQDQTCREYQSTTTIDGRPQPSYGTACLQPDGTWHIVR
jgi:hypothetical protein